MTALPNLSGSQRIPDRAPGVRRQALGFRRRAWGAGPQGSRTGL